MDVLKTQSEYRWWAEHLIADVYAKIALRDSKPATHGRQTSTAPQGRGKDWAHLQPDVLNRILCKDGQQLEMRLVCRAWATAVAATIHSLKASAHLCAYIDLRHLAKFPLRQLDLRGLHVDRVLHTLPELPQLVSLHLGRCNFTTAAISCLERLTALTELELTVSKACRLDDSAMTALEGLPRLATLAVTCAFGNPDALLQQISRLCNLTSLAMQLHRQLYAKQPPLSDAWMTRLRSLSLSLCKWHPKDASNANQAVHPKRLASMVPHLMQLEDLHLSVGTSWEVTHAALVALGCRISLATSIILGEDEPDFQNLQALTLCHKVDIPPATIPARFTNLRSLDVEYPACNELLVGLSGLPSLTHLGLHEGLGARTMHNPYEPPSGLTSFCFYWHYDIPGAEQARLLKHILQLPSLKSLLLGFGEEDFEELEDGSWGMYGHLSALTASVTLHLYIETEVRSLRCLTQIPNVQGLFLACENVSKAALDDAARLTGLKRIFLYNAVVDFDAKWMGEFLGCLPGLKNVRLSRILDRQRRVCVWPVYGMLELGY